MCFRPKDVPSKKVVLVELERTKASLEQENSALRLKLKDLQDDATRAVKERDNLSAQRADLEAQLRRRGDRTAHLLTRVGCLRTSLASRLQDLLDRHFAVSTAQFPRDLGVDAKPLPALASQQPPVQTASVRVIQPDCLEDDLRAASADGLTSQTKGLSSEPPFPSAAAKGASPRFVDPLHGGSHDPHGRGQEGLTVEQQLDRELELLARAHDQALAEASALQAKLRKAESDHADLRADVAGVRRRLEQTEANATDQQQVLKLRCAALEQENEQLTGMNTEMKRRLDEAEGELSSARRQWTADAAQLSKQAAEMGSTSSRLREAEAEVRSLQGQLAAAEARAQEASSKAAELQSQAAEKALALESAEATAAASHAELESVQALVQKLQSQVVKLRQDHDAVAAELREGAESKRAAAEALDAARAQLVEAQREAAAAQHQAAQQAQALADAEAQLQESRASLAATGERLTRALDELASNESRLSEANAQCLSTKQSVISTAKQLANMAKDHSTALAKLHALEAESATLQEQLAAARETEASLRAQAEANGIAARDSREAATAAAAEVARLRVAYDSTSADLRRKIMLLTAIARMADKGGQAAAGSSRSRDAQAADPSEGYGAVTSEQQLRLKVCESPLPLLGALTAGIMDSSRLRHLSLDMDTSREVTWEKAGLRICCLAAAIGLNNSLQTLQLGGWTWGELGNGTALPFLALGGGAASGGVAGGMLRSVQLATNLFDVEAAAMLKDLLAAGLVELAAGGGPADEEEEAGQRAGDGASGQLQGTLRLYSGNERLDGWYNHMLQLATRRLPLPPPSAGSGASSGSSIASTSVSPSPSNAGANSATPPLSPSPSSASAGAGTGAAASAAAFPNLECDLSAEALESHHMVLVMTVLLSCPGLRRLRLDGNKLGDGGAALLALGLSTNTGLRELYLSRNGIRAAGARSLARCLEGSNSTLLRLDLSGQRLEGLGPLGAEAMAQALRINRALEDLNLSSCGLSGAAAACFASAIRAAGAMRPADRPPSSSSAGGADIQPRGGLREPPYASNSVSISCGGAIGGGVGLGGGALRRLALAGNGIDAPTVQVLQAAAAERPGLALVL